MKKVTPKAQLVFREKLVLRGGLVREVVIWRISKGERYPDGVRYRLALVNPFIGSVLVLFDNHYPKGHHVHSSNGTERAYRFESVEKLVDDFLSMAEEEMRKNESKKD